MSATSCAWWSAAARSASATAGVLLEAGAQVRLVAPRIDPALLEQPRVKAIAARFEAQHLDGIMLAIAATNDRGVNRQVSELAQARNIPVNVVDDPELCSFIMPAILDRSPLMVAFSSGGASPVLTRMMRGKLETMIPQNYSSLAGFAERYRERVKQRVTNPAKRRIFWENVLEGVIADRSADAADSTPPGSLRADLDLRLTMRAALDFIAQPLQVRRQLRTVNRRRVLLRLVKFLRLQRARSCPPPSPSR